MTPYSVTVNPVPRFGVGAGSTETRDNDDIPGKVSWLRDRAEEVLTKAEGMRHPEAREPLLRLAAVYEKTARELEALIKREPVTQQQPQTQPKKRRQPD